MNPFKIFAKTKPVPKATETFTYNAPATPAVKEIQMGFLSALKGDFKKAFSWFASPKGQAVVQATEGLIEDVWPAATGLINIINVWGTEAIKTETLAAAATTGDGSGLQKAAIVLSTVTPQVLAFAQENGLPTPTAATLSSVNDDIVAIINKLTGVTPVTAASTLQAAA